jgi:hypothetical protein
MTFIANEQAATSTVKQLNQLFRRIRPKPVEQHPEMLMLNELRTVRSVTEEECMTMSGKHAH